nr:uncharacterized protein LOC129260758 [Lytechinus pictus]
MAECNEIYGIGGDGPKGSPVSGSSRAVSKLTIVLGNNGNQNAQDAEYHTEYRTERRIEETYTEYSSSTFPRRHGSAKSHMRRRGDGPDTGAYSYAFRRGECRPVHTNNISAVGSYESRGTDSADYGEIQSSYTRIENGTEVRFAVSSADPNVRLRIIPSSHPQSRHGHGNNNIATITHVNTTNEQPLSGSYQELNRCIDETELKTSSRTTDRSNVGSYGGDERPAAPNPRYDNDDTGIRAQGVYSGGVFVKPRSECFVLKTARQFDSKNGAGGVNVNRSGPSINEDAKGGRFVSPQENRERASVERSTGNYMVDGLKSNSKTSSLTSNSRPHVQQIVQQLEGDNSETIRNRGRSFSFVRHLGTNVDLSEPCVDNKLGRNNRSESEDPAPHQPSSLTLSNAGAWGGRYPDSVDAMHSSRAPSCEGQRTAGSDMSTSTFAASSDSDAASGERNYSSSLYLQGNQLRDVGASQRGGLYVRDGNKAASAPATPSNEPGYESPADEHYDKQTLGDLTSQSHDRSQRYRSDFERQRKQGGIFSSSFQSGNDSRDYSFGGTQHDSSNTAHAHRTRVLSPNRIGEGESGAKPLTSPSSKTSPTHKLKPLAVQKVSKRSLQTFDFSPISSRSTSRRSSVSSQSGNDSKDLQNLAKNLSEAVSRRRTEGMSSSSHSSQGSNNDLTSVHNTGSQAEGKHVRSESMSPVFPSEQNTGPSPNQLKTPTSPADSTYQNMSGDTVTIRKDYSSLKVPRPNVLVPSGSLSRTSRWASASSSHTEKPTTKAVSAPTSPDHSRNLQDLTAKLIRDSPAKSPKHPTVHHTKQDSGLCSPDEEDQGCVMDLDHEKEQEIEVQPSHFGRKKGINLPEVPKILSKFNNREDASLNEVASPTSIEKFSLKAHLKPLRPKQKTSISEDEDSYAEKEEREAESGQWARRRKKNSASAFPSSEFSGGGAEGNGRSRSDPTQERKRGGGDNCEPTALDADMFGSLQSSGQGLPPLTDIGEVNLSEDSLSSHNTSISDATADAMFINVCRDVTRGTDVIINASIENEEKNGKMIKKTKSLTWPNGDKTTNELSQYTQGIQESTSAPVVSERQEDVAKAQEINRRYSPGQATHLSSESEDSVSNQPLGRNGGNVTHGKRHSSLSDPTSEVQAIKHVRAASEPATMPVAPKNASSKNAGTPPQMHERTKSVGEQQKPRPARRQPILPGQHFLRPQMLNIHMSTPDLSKAKTPDSPSLAPGPKAGSCATLPRATSDKKGGELSPASRRRQKQQVRTNTLYQYTLYYSVF